MEAKPNGGATRFLCRECLCQINLQKLQPEKEGRPEAWSMGATRLGFILLLMAGASASILYGVGSGHLFRGIVQALLLIFVIGFPTYLVTNRGYRNMRLYSGLLYLLMGLWILLWTFLPEITGEVKRDLASIAFSLLLLGSVINATFIWSVKRYPRL